MRRGGGGGSSFGAVDWVGGVGVGWSGDGHGVERAEELEICGVVRWIGFRL